MKLLCYVNIEERTAVSIHQKRPFPPNSPSLAAAPDSPPAPFTVEPGTD
ncbi:MAG: hypothetical protein KC443_13560 [Anaerolineales bacterium]|nr:hypothetical protein [Anaerolineales bacterium]